MIEVLKFIALPVPAGTQPAGATGADADDPAVSDFSQLLEAGMGRGADAAIPGSLLPSDAGQAADSMTESPRDDPEAILNAIAASQLPVDVRQIAAVPATMAVQLAAQAGAASADANSAPAAEAPARAPRGSQRAIAAADEGRIQPQAAHAESPAEKFSLPAAFRQATATERGAGGELRAELAGKSIPESQSATHLLLSHQPQHAVRETAATRVEQLQQPLGTPAWNEGFADRVVWMAKNDIQSAELRLNPADLGPIDVTLTLTGEDKTQATVQFSAAHASTREAIETALPRLREMMQESGITLGQAGVDANTSQAADGERRQQNGNQSGRLAAQGEVATGTLTLPASNRSQGRGLVDTFA